jgi:prepilin-type N-terminal cleavage/methylation domain-containing protein
MTLHLQTPKRQRQTVPGLASGFTLIEMGVVLLILAILLTGVAVTMTGRVEEQRRTTTMAKLSAIETAIVMYVSQMQRLPCPADGLLVSNNANAGLERRDANGNCTGQQVNGVVPWRTIGLTEADATDGWYHRITYRSAPFLTYDNAMNMMGCDVGGGLPASAEPNKNPPPGPPTNPGYYCTTAAAPGGCTSPINFLEDKGFQIISDGAVIAMNPSADAMYQPSVLTITLAPPIPAPPSGAAFVLISHGANGAGSFNDQGILQAATGAEGANEAANKNPKTVPVDNTLTSFNDYQYSAETTTYFDDILVRPSVYAVINKAQLGPKSRNP